MSDFDETAARERWTRAAENQALLEYSFVVEERLYGELQRVAYKAYREHGHTSQDYIDANAAASAQAKRCMEVSNQRLDAREEFVAASLWLHGCESHVVGR